MSHKETRFSRPSTYLPHGVKPKRIRLAGILFTIGRIQSDFLPMFQVLNSGIGIDVPRRAKDVEGLGEHIVVYNASVDGEARHEQDNVATAKEDVPDLRRGAILEYIFKKYQQFI